jgi:hypothetical protein
VFVAIGEHDGVDALENAAAIRSRAARVRRPGADRRRVLPLGDGDRDRGIVLGINAFDQPNVQEAKDATKEILASGSVEDPGSTTWDALEKEVGEGDYVAILAYLDRTSETEDATRAGVRLAIRDRYKVATTTGFGPVPALDRASCTRAARTAACSSRWWTGIGPSTCRSPASTYTFGTLIDAQALGDLRALRKRGRRVARVTFDQLMEVG